MPRVPSYIQPPPNAGGPKIDASKVNDGVNDLLRQIIQLAGSDITAIVEPVAAMPASGAFALPVRTPAPNFDTGIEAPGTATLTAASNIGGSESAYLDGVAFVNTSGQSQTVGATNGGGQYIVAPFELAGGATVVIQKHGRPIVGLKWRLPSGTTGQAWGRK